MILMASDAVHMDFPCFLSKSLTDRLKLISYNFFWKMNFNVGT